MALAAPTDPRERARHERRAARDLSSRAPRGLRRSRERLVELGAFVALALVTSGCAARLEVDRALGAGPHVRLPYTGVRDAQRRFADYSGVRGDILAPAASTPARASEPRGRR